MARLYANENFPVDVVRELRALGHDVLTTHDAGKSNQGIEDKAVLRYAIDNDRCVITINRRDFIRLHRAIPNHAGIIVCTENRDYAAFARRIDFEISRAPALANQLLRVVRGDAGKPA
jgi:predicted nuclease of predicted toxin-antitoxin system